MLKQWRFFLDGKKCTAAAVLSFFGSLLNVIRGGTEMYNESKQRKMPESFWDMGDSAFAVATAAATVAEDDLALVV